MRRKNFHYTLTMLLLLVMQRKEMKNIFLTPCTSASSSPFRRNSWRFLPHFAACDDLKRLYNFNFAEISFFFAIFLFVSEEIPVRFVVRVWTGWICARIFHSSLVSQINKSIISLHANPTRNFKRALSMRSIASCACCSTIESENKLVFLERACKKKSILSFSHLRLLKDCL